MCSTASRVAVNATDAIPHCYPLPRTFAQPRPDVQDAKPCKESIANERTVLVHTTVGNVKLSLPNMSEWMRVPMDLCGKISECSCGYCAQVRDVEHGRGPLQLPREGV
ncbi:hypothetical protein ERJ75_000432600 [Trypanosoma vivax]|nr:hypothetical protein ERJ75_000432600 [Trypanosoma vivax]